MPTALNCQTSFYILNERAAKQADLIPSDLIPSDLTQAELHQQTAGVHGHLLQFVVLMPVEIVLKINTDANVVGNNC